MTNSDSDGKLRAWRSHRQGLDGRLSGKPPAEVLEQTGWARSVGGVGPYLTLFSRSGTSRQAADAAVASLEIHELPAARGCTYVLPACDFALGLKAGQNFGGGEMKTAAKLGVTQKEIDKLCDAVLKALAKGPLDPQGIRDATGNAARSLGQEGKKKGLTTTLPVALGKLQSIGEIRRVPVNGRLDQQRYRYALWRPNPLGNFKMPPEQVNTELARRFFAWTGPATRAEFQTFSGLGANAAKSAMEPLRLEPMEKGSDRVMLPGDREKLSAFKVPKQAQYVLVSSLDGAILLRSDLKGMLDEADAKRKVLAEKSDLPSHAILDRGRVVGLWLYDPSTESIAWASFVPKNKDLESAVERTQNYIRDQLGDARSFSLDSPKSRAPLIQSLRKAAAG